MSDPTADPDRSDRSASEEPAEEQHQPRPLIERIGLALIALVMAAAFGGVAVAAWVGGEVFLAAMGAIGCLMTVWVGGMTVLRN
jgi:fatty acid desaturase